MTNKSSTYLGGGVYASFDDLGITLSDGRISDGAPKLFLRADVFDELVKFGNSMFAAEKSQKEYATADGKPITSKDGLLWVDGRVVDVHEADRLARLHGFAYAEQLVRAISEGSK